MYELFVDYLLCLLYTVCFLLFDYNFIIIRIKELLKGTFKESLTQTIAPKLVAIEKAFFEQIFRRIAEQNEQNKHSHKNMRLTTAQRKTRTQFHYIYYLAMSKPQNSCSMLRLPVTALTYHLCCCLHFDAILRCCTCWHQLMYHCVCDDFFVKYITRYSKVHRITIISTIDYDTYTIQDHHSNANRLPVNLLIQL